MGWDCAPVAMASRPVSTTRCRWCPVAAPSMAIHASILEFAMGSEGRSRNLLVAAAVAAAIAHAQAHAQTAPLPLPWVANACGSNASGFVTQGSASAVQAGTTLTVNQQTANATLNWQSFNVARGNTVTFQQPDGSSIALNRIFQGDPSRILGSLNANGR